MLGTLVTVAALVKLPKVSVFGAGAEIDIGGDGGGGEGDDVCAGGAGECLDVGGVEGAACGGESELVAACAEIDRGDGAVECDGIVGGAA